MSASATGATRAATAALPDGEVHLWCARVEAPEVVARYERYRGWLAPAERERNERFLIERPRREHLVTRALVRWVLSRYVPAVAPAQWSFRENEWGKPEIDGPWLVQPQPLRFNLSNTNGLVVCAVTVGREIGVDVENVVERRAPVEIAERYFSTTEIAALRALSPELRPARFFDYWTLKESYIKARGLGLSIPLDQFSFVLDAGDIDGNGAVRISFDARLADDPARWQFARLRPTDAHRVAIAVERRAADEAPIPITLRFCVPLDED